ncbi:MAG: response regulator receiver protein [Parcubacteria group bacterium Greene0714_4]|nr:MAG: response regulator receiver protein [Parcubacteria group bacterium Greene1014_15]TSD08128.1 MAG: response regulator receiver protein [Parcubacteria group bacterium Greene0714_4]
MTHQRKIHILLIDDDEDFRRLFGAKLAEHAYEVLYATNAENGREMARNYKPDLILLDVRMPGTDGFTIARAMRQEDATKNIPIVFLTNEDFSLEAKQWVKELYVKDVIHKSIDLNEFVEHVSAVVRAMGK